MTPVSENVDPADRVAEHWEGEYAGVGRRWSGRVNTTMADVVSDLGPGADRIAVDLGCGEGGDAVWLAEQGWCVTAVDISATAIARGTEAAVDRGVGDRIAWVRQDLAAGAPIGGSTAEAVDLVAATFLHSSVELPRTRILRRAAEMIRPGGHLLLVSHVFETAEDIPPWARDRHHVDGGDHGGGPGGMPEDLLSPEQEVAALDLAPEEWDVVIQEVRPRQATGPDGWGSAAVKDGVVLLRRLD